MELPQVSQSHGSPAQAFVRAVKEAQVTLARTAAQETALDGATAFSCADRPGVHMLNFAAHLRVPSGSTAQTVVKAVDDHFAGRGLTCHVLHANDAAWPQDLIDAASARGYRADSPAWVYRLGRFRRPEHEAAGLQVIPGRAALGPLRQFHLTCAREVYEADDALAGDLAQTRIDHLDEPRIA